MQILEAFRALRALDEDMFDMTADGIKDLSDFMDSDDLADEVEVIDPEAETVEDLKDSYVGKVILDCCVCHSKLYKDKEEVILDETGELANVGEDCPYCFTPDGFKVIGEVAEYSDAPAEEESADGNDSDDVEVEEEEEVEVEEEPKNEPVKENFRRRPGHGQTRRTRRIAESTANGNAEGGFIDNSKRPGGNTKASGSNHQALAGKKTRTVKAKDLKPGMVTNTGEVKRVTNIGWVNGEQSYEIGYGGIGKGGSYASDVVASDKEYEILDEGIFDKFKKKPDYWSEEEVAKRKKAMDDEYEEQQRKEAEAERRRGAEITADWAKKDKMQREVDAEHNRKRSRSIKVDTPSNTGHRGINYSGGDYYPEGLDPINESINSLALDTDDTHMEMTSDENGKVTVTTEPITSGVDSEEMIAPVSDETIAEIEMNTEEEGTDEEVMPEEVPEEVEGETPEDEVDMEIEEVDDDTLGVHESYIRNVYENVKSYKTTGVTIRGNEMIVEGKIKFDNNHVKKVNFVYEAFTTNGKGKVTFRGHNEVAKNKGAFTLSGNITDKRLVLESLSYNYRTLNEGKVRRVSGTIKA